MHTLRSAAFKISVITATHHRPALLQTQALHSLLSQTCLDFEWVVINDGKDLATRDLINTSDFPFHTQYLELDHAQDQFGLCVARNLGINAAQGQLIGYLDDDNQLRPEFIARTLNWFHQHPNLFGCIPQQWRRRDIYHQGTRIKAGNPFISPKSGTSIDDLIDQRSLFDSNGFIHKRQDAPAWNPGYRIYCDYEYFVRCVSHELEIGFNTQVMVDYVQTSDGEIGRSNYGQWAQELQRLYNNRHKYAGIVGWADWMPQSIQTYQDKAQMKISGFER